MTSSKQDLIFMSHWRSSLKAQPSQAAKSVLGLFVCFVALATLSLLTLHAQVQNGTISVTITDPGEAVVPDAVVTLMGNATGLVLHIQSSKVGHYSFPQLVPGDYIITVDQKGFQKATSTRSPSQWDRPRSSTSRSRSAVRPKPSPSLQVTASD
jgi:hypothetical protein